MGYLLIVVNSHLSFMSQENYHVDVLKERSFHLTFFITR